MSVEGTGKAEARRVPPPGVLTIFVGFYGDVVSNHLLQQALPRRKSRTISRMCIAHGKLRKICCCAACVFASRIFVCRALQNSYSMLAKVGTTQAMLDQMTRFDEFNKLIGMEACLAAEDRLTRREGDKLTVRVRGQTKKM